MRLTGVLEQVETYQARAFAAADAATSDTVVFVDRVEPFFTEAGAVTVDINGDEYTATPTADDEAPYITVSPALVADVDELDPVTVLPAAEVKVAWVSFPSADDEGDLTSYLVPHNLKAYTALADGPKNDDERVAVVVETDPPELVDVANRPVLLDGATIDPDSTIPLPALTDGLPPSGSPEPAVEPFAIGGVRWSVTPVANADPVRFRVYADTVDPPTIDAAHLVDDTGSWSGSFSAIDGARLLPDDPAADIDPIYVACIEYDADGDAAVSATSDPVTPRRASNSDISADIGLFGKVQANQIESGEVTANLAMLGEVSVDGSLTVYADPSHAEPRVQLRPDGSVFRGGAELDSASVSDQLLIRGTGHVTTDASLILDNGVGDPMVAPTLTATPEPSVWPSPTSGGYAARGLCWDAANTRWLRLIRRTSDGLARVQTINTSGVTTSTVSLGTAIDVNGITVIGSNWYVMVKSEFGTGVPHWRAIRYSTAGALLQTNDGSIPLFFDRPCVGTDGTNLLIAAQTSTNVRVLVYDDADIDSLLGSYTWADTFADSNLGYVGSGSFDFGGSRIVINAGSEVRTFTTSGSTLTEQTAEAFSLPSTSFGGGFTWDGTSFYSTHGATVLYKYNDHYPGAGDTAYVAYTDTDSGSGDHTKASPVASVELVARWFVQAALPPAPSGADDPVVYAAIDTTPPTVTALLERSETVTARNVLLDPSTAGGSALGTDSNTFGAAGTPGSIASSSGGFEVHGDGDGSWPLLGTSDQKVLATSASPTSTTNINMPDLNMTVTVGSTADIVWVGLSAQVRITIVPGTINIVELLVDGVAETQALTTELTSLGRLTSHRLWRITGLSAGSHTLAFRTRNTAGSSGATVVAFGTDATYQTNA